VLLLGVQCPAVRIHIQYFIKNISGHLPAAGKQLGESGRFCTRALQRRQDRQIDFQESMVFHRQCNKKVILSDFFATPT